MRNEKISNKTRKNISDTEMFIAIAAHEFQNPLTSLGLTMRCLKKDLEHLSEDTGSEHLSKSILNIRRCEHIYGKLNNLVTKLLEFGKIQSGQMEVINKKMDLRFLLAEVVERFDSTGMKVRLTARSNHGIIGYWDPSRIEQVATNLLSNAVKYGDGKPVEVDVSLSKDSNTALLVVKDSGFGIPADLQPKIFQKFERGDSPSAISGLGLGLYISKQIVDAHGGKIFFKCPKEGGAIFSVELPFYPSAISLN